MSKVNPREYAEQAKRRSQDPHHRAELARAKSDVRASLQRTPVGEPAKATRTLSYLLDEVFRVPGTKFRFGIDPIMSVFPAVGAGVGAIFGTVILADAVRLRAPIPVLARMLFNHLLNWLLSLIPLIGPFLDAWWKSNAKNVKLLDRTIKNRTQVRKATITYWIMVAVFSSIALLMIISAPFLLLWWLDSVVTGG